VYATAVPGVPYVAPRASFGISFSCSNCGMQFFQKTHTWAMNFTRPPLVYSVERGGPADRAGIRRGDIITQVNGKPIESDEGSRIFAQTKPGQTVKFTVRRDGKTQTFAVKAAARQTLPPDLTMTTRALERASQSLSEIKRTQEAQLKRLLRESSTYRSGADGDAMREAQQRLLDEEREHARKLTELSADMARANSEMTRAQLAMRAAMADSARAICAVPAIAPVAAGTTPRGVRTLRYTGSIGSADVEVRGAPVSVSENDDEIVITTGATVVRVQKKK
jgi:membrane-associated protease RseP (regulator of RpoE activity)